jgi:hypothetical protein
MLTWLVVFDAQRCVISTLPVENRFNPTVVDAHDDLVQHRADNSLARGNLCILMCPSRLQIGS